jgi:hypothetical protein
LIAVCNLPTVLPVFCHFYFSNAQKRIPSGSHDRGSIRITQARRATAYRDGEFMRFLTIALDHDAAYGKK